MASSSSVKPKAQSRKRILLFFIILFYVWDQQRAHEPLATAHRNAPKMCTTAINNNTHAHCCGSSHCWVLDAPTWWRRNRIRIYARITRAALFRVVSKRQGRRWHCLHALLYMRCKHHSSFVLDSWQLQGFYGLKLEIYPWRYHIGPKCKECLFLFIITSTVPMFPSILVRHKIKSRVFPE